MSLGIFFDKELSRQRPRVRVPSSPPFQIKHLGKWRHSGVGTKRYQKGTNSKAGNGSTTLAIPIAGSVTLEASGFSGRRSLLLIRDEKRYHRGLRSTLLRGYRLSVGVESDAYRRMPHQFLHYLEFGTRRPEQRGVRPAESMPANPLRDAQLFRDGTDVMPKKLLSPIRVLPSILGTGEHPTLQSSIGCSAMPTPQGADQMIVKRHGFLGSLRLTFPDDLLHDGSSHPELFVLEITSFHLRANSSLCLSPVATSNKTMIRSLGSSAASNWRTSSLVRTSGALRRLALCRTH